MTRSRSVLFLIVFVALCVFTREARSQDKNTATFDPDGTAHLTRVIRPPVTISPEAQKWMKSLSNSGTPDKDLAERRAHTTSGGSASRPWRENYFR